MQHVGFRALHSIAYVQDKSSANHSLGYGCILIRMCEAQQGIAQINQNAN